MEYNFTTKKNTKIGQADKQEVVYTYKDTVFRMLFSNRKELLALYNAVNGTEYDNPDDLEITTLENAIYMSYKNDISFVLDLRLNLFEHQSTVNPNMPLRDLMYVTRVFEKILMKYDLYSTRLIRLPNPQFITFYNGVAKQPERKIYRLSDAFERPEKEPSLELIVTQLNINPGYNQELMEKCPSLYGYMCYVEKIRQYRKLHPLDQAVQIAVDECIGEGILVDFLKENKAGVVAMSIFEYDEELHLRTLREEGFEEKLISQICRKLQKNKLPEVIAEELEEDLSHVEEICEIAKQFAPDYDTMQIYERLYAKK